MPEKYGRYRLHEAGQGGETDVFRPENIEKGKEGKKGLVLKNMSQINTWGYSGADGLKWESGPNGFDEHFKEALSARYEAMKAEYGSLIPHARIVRNPAHPDWYLVAQEFIELADPPALADWYPADIEDEDVRLQLRAFVEKMKNNIVRVQKGEDVPLPDLAKENLVLHKDERGFSYIDSGLVGMGEFDMYDLVDIARIELLSGTTPDALQQDPFYRALFEEIEVAGIDVEDRENVNEWYSALLDVTATDEGGEVKKVRVI